MNYILLSSVKRLICSLGAAVPDVEALTEGLDANGFAEREGGGERGGVRSRRRRR